MKYKLVPVDKSVLRELRPVEPFGNVFLMPVKSGIRVVIDSGTGWQQVGYVFDDALTANLYIERVYS